MGKLIRLEHDTEPLIDPSALGQMKASGGMWAAYQNHDLSSRNIGHLKFLKVGPTCTFKEPPAHFPAGTISEGTNYLFVGFVDLESGDIKES